MVESDKRYINEAQTMASWGFIYAIRRDNGDIKIGTTLHIPTRMAQLRQRYGNLDVLGFTEGYEQEEAVYHKRFEAHRISIIHSRHGGHQFTEWFKPAPEIMEWITTELRPYSNPNAKKFYKPTTHPMSDTGAAT
jgi:T5orf172 domain-containing protein